MELLVWVPVISIVLTIVIAAIYSAINSSGPREPVHMNLTPDDPPTPVETFTTQHDNPDIADQFDGRLTNVFKNPMKGIL